MTSKDRLVNSDTAVCVGVKINQNVLYMKTLIVQLFLLFLKATLVDCFASTDKNSYFNNSIIILKIPALKWYDKNLKYHAVVYKTTDKISAFQVI